MLRAACAYVKARGGAMLEGHPVDTRRERRPAACAWTGFVLAFRDGRTETRPIMRRTLG